MFRRATYPQYSAYVLYPPQVDETVILYRVTETIDNILAEFPYANFHICGDFNVHSKEFTLIKLTKKVKMSRFLICLTRFIEEHGRVPYTTGHQVNLIEIFFFEKFRAEVLSHRQRTSNYSLDSVKVDVKLTVSSDRLF